MKNKYIIIILLSLSLTSCNSLKDDFFDFIFNTDGVSLSRVCEDNPSIFSEGRSVEIYTVSQEDMGKIIQHIKSDSIRPNQSSGYSKNNNRSFMWQQTSTGNVDPVSQFISSEMKEDINSCYTKDDLLKIISTSNNYYLSLNDSLGRTRLFLLDTQNLKLFLLTSYLV